MQQLLTPETFEFFATYLLAGYVVIIVRSRFVSGLRPKASELVIEAVLFSLINELTAIALGVIGAQVLGVPTPEDGTLWERLLFFAKVLVMPALMGSLLGYTLTSGLKNAVLRRLALPVIHPAQTGHDFAFGYNRSACFVIVSYFDGTTVAGYFGEASLAASDENRSDLYLERLYEIGDDGKWSQATPPRSGLISLKDVRSIEFLENNGDGDAQEDDR